MRDEAVTAISKIMWSWEIHSPKIQENPIVSYPLKITTKLPAYMCPYKGQMKSLEGGHVNIHVT